MDSRNNALLIVGHGSTVNPDSSEPTLAHAAEIRRRGIFTEVGCAFWKEEPSLRDAVAMFPDAREVFVVPNFISEGYFTQTVIPRELELNGPVTIRPNDQRWNYCAPVGNHSMMTELLQQRAAEVAPGVDPGTASLLIVAHGTDLNENSAVAAKREVEKIAALGKYARVLNVYMEEAPLVKDWRRLTDTEAVIVVPFFISDGLHSYEDIPVLLGISRSDGFPAVIAPGDDGHGNRRSLDGVFRGNPYRIDGRTLYYARSIGTDPRFADAIVAQAETFNGVN